MDQAMNRFDEYAAKWDENPVRREMARAVAQKMIDRLDLSTSMKALEIGSGTGLVTLQLAPHLGSITALDGSQNMLEELKKKMEILEISNIHLHFADLEKDPLPGGGYDMIFSNMVIHHIKNANSLLKKAYDVLAPGGRLVITDLDTEDGSFHGDMPGVHHFGFSRGAFISCFERYGFQRCTVQDAHVMEKKSAQGDLRSYSLFMATGLKV